MNKIKYSLQTLLFLLILGTCNAQIPKTIDLSNERELSYILSNIWSFNVDKVLLNRGLVINIFLMSDSKATPDGYFEGTDGSLTSIIITTGGDYYTSNKLFKIEGVINPKILEIKELVYPKFSISIEHGFYNQRKIESFIFEGN